jgi:hypothetical protein
MTVSEYITRFTQLSRYAPNEWTQTRRRKIIFSLGLMMVYLCTGGPRLCEFLGHGEQGIGTGEPLWYHGAQV